MSQLRPYDRLMLDHEMPGCLVVQLLPVEGRWTFVVLLCIASQAEGDDRGTLIVKDQTPVESEWVAKYAGVTVETVEDTLRVLAEHGSLVMEDRHGALRWENWERYNPPRKPSDERPAQNARKRKQRDKERGEQSDQLALDHQSEEEGRTPQMVMDDKSAAGLRVAPDATNRACPVAICAAQPGEPCRDRKGVVKAKPHAKRLRAPDPDAFFRSDRGGQLVRPALPVDADGWAPIADVLRQGVEDHKFGIYLAPLRLVAEQGVTLYVRVPDDIRTWVRDRYLGLINRAAQDVRGPQAVVQLVDEQWRPAEVAA